MPSKRVEQRNAYAGDPPRAWLRLTVNALDGTVRELILMVDTGSPCPIIVSPDVLRTFILEEADDIATNFGPMEGGWVDAAIAEVGFRDRVEAYASDAVVAALRQSDPRFQGLAGLPLLRNLEYGGDAGAFWLRRPRGPSSSRRRRR